MIKYLIVLLSCSRGENVIFFKDELLVLDHIVFVWNNYCKNGEYMIRLPGQHGSRS